MIPIQIPVRDTFPKNEVPTVNSVLKKLERQVLIEKSKKKGPYGVNKLHLTARAMEYVEYCRAEISKQKILNKEKN